MLITRPCTEARRDSGPVHTSNVTMWNRNGKWLATGNKRVQSKFGGKHLVGLESSSHSGSLSDQQAEHMPLPNFRMQSPTIQ